MCYAGMNVKEGKTGHVCTPKRWPHVSRTLRRPMRKVVFAAKASQRALGARLRPCRCGLATRFPAAGGDHEAVAPASSDVRMPGSEWGRFGGNLRQPPALNPGETA